MACLEDELSDTRMEAAKLKTELVSERSAWEVKCSEMQSRINEVRYSCANNSVVMAIGATV